MRSTISMKLSVFAAVGLLGACGGSTAKLVDTTMNQTGDKSSAQKYPTGPFGYAQGSIIENISFLGKVDPAGASGTGNYSSLALQTVSLGDFYNDATVKFVMMSGVAGWCGPCNQEQSQVPAAQKTYEPMGVKFFEAMIQGYDESTGIPATEADLDKWQQLHKLHVGIGMDPEDKIHAYADIAAFPLNMVVRTSDMKIVFMQTGEVDVATILADVVSAP